MTPADRKRAREVAASLFVDGAGVPARRLVMERRDGQFNEAGWCERAIADRIATALASERAAATAACAEKCEAVAVATRNGAAWRDPQGRCIADDPALAQIPEWIAEGYSGAATCIRALSPEGWVGVRREDATLAVSALTIVAARWALNEDEPLPVAAKMADDAADRIRAALVRGGT